MIFEETPQPYKYSQRNPTGFHVNMTEKQLKHWANSSCMGNSAAIMGKTWFERGVKIPEFDRPDVDEFVLEDLTKNHDLYEAEWKLQSRWTANSSIDQRFFYDFWEFWFNNWASLLDVLRGELPDDEDKALAEVERLCGPEKYLLMLGTNLTHSGHVVCVFGANAQKRTMFLADPWGISDENGSYRIPPGTKGTEEACGVYEKNVDDDPDDWRGENYVAVRALIGS